MRGLRPATWWDLLSVALAFATAAAAWQVELRTRVPLGWAALALGYFVLATVLLLRLGAHNNAAALGGGALATGGARYHAGYGMLSGIACAVVVGIGVLWARRGGPFPRPSVRDLVRAW